MLELQEPLGKGGLCEVFAARVLEGPLRGERVAVKRLLPERLRDPEARAMLVNEAEIGRWLDHPHVLKCHGLGELEGRPFVALELIEGVDLQKLLEHCKRRKILLPAQVALYITRAVLEALAHAHAANAQGGKPLALVHCDVTPANVLVSVTGEVKLGDFGAASARWGAARATHRLGKAGYRSPELLAGKVSQQDDLWSAAVLLYEQLTLQLPFSGGTEALLRPDVPPGVWVLLQRALSRAPRERFTTAEQFSRAVARMCDEKVATPLAVAAVVRALSVRP